MDNMNQGTGHYNMDNMNQGTGHTMLVSSSSSNLFTFFAVGTGTASGGDCTSAVEAGDRSPDLPCRGFGHLTDGKKSKWLCSYVGNGFLVESSEVFI